AARDIRLPTLWLSDARQHTVYFERSDHRRERLATHAVPIRSPLLQSDVMAQPGARANALTGLEISNNGIPLHPSPSFGRASPSLVARGSSLTLGCIHSHD